MWTDLGGLNGAIVTEVSLQFPKALPVAEWCEIGKILGQAHRRLHWAIGDWWVHADHGNYGYRKQQVEDWGGLSFQTCENLGAVSRRFTTSRRREVLSFSHHAEVAYLPPIASRRTP
jgi:hypothetical protein